MGAVRNAIERAVADAGIGRPVAVERVDAGASNAVHTVTLAGGDRLIARTRAGGSDPYLAERAVMDRVRAHDVPAPYVLGVAAVDGIAVMLTEWLPGARLADLRLDGDERAAIVERCGALLAAVHEHATHGFGKVGVDGTAPHATFDAWFIDDLRAELDRAELGELRPRMVAAVDAFEHHRLLLRSCVPHLNHGDFSTMNLLVAGGEITGLVDWESAKSGPSALDFGWWDWFGETWGTPFTTDELVAAYRAAGGPDIDHLDELRALALERIRMGYSVWQARRSSPSPRSP